MFVQFTGGSQILTLLGSVLVFGFAERAREATRDDVLQHRLVLAWFVVPCALSLGYSLLVTPIAHPRYLTVCVPAWLLMAAVMLESIDTTSLRALSVAAFLSLSAFRVQAYYDRYQKERWDEVARLIAQRAARGDVLVLDTLGAEALHYSVDQLKLSARLPAPWPQRTWGFPVPTAAPIAAAELSRRLNGARRIWNVQNRSTGLNAERLSTSHILVWTRQFEPNDGDDASLFADSRGRIVTVHLFMPKLLHRP